MKLSHILLGFVLIIFASCNSDSSTGNSETSTTDETKTHVAEPLGDLGIPDGNYSLTKDKPLINWSAKKISGSGHSGIIPAARGKFIVEEGVITKGLISFDMKGFEVTDIDGDSKENFDNHLKSADFFDVDKFPEAILSFNNSAINEDGKKTLSCTFDMHGIAVDYVIPFTLKEKKITQGGIGYQISGEFFVNRTKHDITYGSGSFFDNLGDKAIKDEVLISFEFLAL